MVNAHKDPGTPDCRGGTRYLWWLVRQQADRSVAAALISCVWMVFLATSPYLLSQAIDEGLLPGDHRALLKWTAALFVVGALSSWLNILRHRTMIRLRMDANFRTVEVVVAHAVRLGAALPRRVGSGEVVTIGVSDVTTIATSLTVIGPGVGAIAAYGVVAGLLVPLSLPIAAVVLLGIPLIAVIVGPLLRRLQSIETDYRERQSVLTARIADLAGGLRVLNGLGGKGPVRDAFRHDSRQLRAQGYRFAATASWVQALGVGLPTLFLAVVTWLAARLAVQGALTVGELVSVYGYVTVLVRPTGYFVEWGYQVSSGVVAARRVIRFLLLEPLPDHGIRNAPAAPSALHDPVSGARVLPGRLTALATARPAEATALVDRLGRYAPTAVTWGGTPLDEIPLAQIRERILVADHEADLFAGPIRALVGGRHDRDDVTITRALHAAVAEDIVQGLPDGLDSAIEAQGRNLSGGQRQRVRLVRALLSDPEILLAVEPTSALDAHTEAQVARRLRAAREGRTTVVTSTSPLMLDHADTVHYLVDGKVVATGRHRELLAEEPGYRALVARDSGEDGDTPGLRRTTPAEDTPGIRHTTAQDTPGIRHTTAQDTPGLHRTATEDTLDRPAPRTSMTPPPEEAVR
ncbi:ABC transporter ATP-binding protein [Streptomyces sp. NPDC002643]